MPKIAALITILIFAFESSAQNNELRILINKPVVGCAAIYDSTLQKIITLKPEKKLDSIELILTYWYEQCDPTVDMIAIRLLADLENNRSIPSGAELADFYHQYLKEIPPSQKNDSIGLIKFLNTWAKRLKVQREWSKEENFLIDFLSQKNMYAALELLFNKEYYAVEHVEKLRNKQSALGYLTSSSELGIGLNSYQNSLSKYFGPSAMIHLGLGFSFGHRSDFHSITQFSFPRYKKDLRIFTRDSIQFSRGWYTMNTGFNYTYAFFQNRRVELRVVLQTSLEILDVENLREEDFENSDDELEEYYAVSRSYGVGLEFRLRWYTAFSGSLRVTYHSANFNNVGNIVLSDLNGGYFNFMLLLPL